jgi:adenine-specific DNA methylase
MDSAHLASPTTFAGFLRVREDPEILHDGEELRRRLLDFILDFSNPDNATDPAHLTLARRLVAAASDALDAPERPLAVDLFGGGGALSLEALRVGADAFAVDLNPVAVLRMKVALEYAPTYGQALREQVEIWGERLRDKVAARLEPLYPAEADRSLPIVFLWTRTLTCHGPECGVEIPLLSRLTITKNRQPAVAVFLSSAGGVIRTTVREVEDGEEVGPGTVRDGTVTCPACGYTIGEKSYRARSRAGDLGERLYGVISRDAEKQRHFRDATDADVAAFERAREEARRLSDDADSPPFPDESLSEDEPRRLNIRQYGFTNWGMLFNERQKVALATFGDVLSSLQADMTVMKIDPGLARATQVVLGMAVSNLAPYLSNMSTYLSDGMISAFIQSSAIPMRADYAEANPLMPDLVGGFDFQLKQSLSALDHLVASDLQPGVVVKGNAVQTFLPDNSVDAVITDPPYYFAIPYADLSDLFYVWLRRFLGGVTPDLFTEDLTNKRDEATQSLPHSQSPSTKDRAHFESVIRDSLVEARRILKPHGIAVIVFANATTEGWESLIRALIDAGWTVTGSWPLETERANRMLARRQSVLASSVHLVCRPREALSHHGEVGDWRAVLDELPRRLHEWLPRLASEGIVGADAIFACLGPALEIFSRFERVEKASGEIVSLDEYLAQVWAAVAHEALSLVFDDAAAAAFEEDARLTVMWLWTINSGEGERTNGADPTPGSFALEYDSARKLAQGLGVPLEEMTDLVHVRRDRASLRSVRERRDALIEVDEAQHVRGEQTQLFQTAEATSYGVPVLADTVLDRVHQAMLLFGDGQSGLLRQFLLESGAGTDNRFWELTQALSALYPATTEEKRWADGVLARKKTLGL